MTNFVPIAHDSDLNVQQCHTHLAGSVLLPSCVVHARFWECVRVNIVEAL